MKLNKTALAITSLILANSATAAEVFSDDTTSLVLEGRAQGAYYFSDDKNTDGDASYIRLAVGGESQINDDFYAFGYYQLQFESNKRDAAGIEDDEFDVRQGYVGVGSDNVAVSYGRQFGAVTLVSDYTDIFPEFGNDAAGVSADKFGTGRSDSVFKVTTSLAGLNVHASYQAENDEVSTDASSYGIAADYQLPYGFKFALGYNNGDTKSGGDDSELVITALSFEYESLYLSALYSDGENWASDGSDVNADYEGIEAVATYRVTEEFTALLGYNKKERNDVEKVDYVSFGAEYDLSKNFKALAEYKLTDVNNEEDVFAIAGRYSF